jgi:TPR repeat protein
MVFSPLTRVAKMCAASLAVCFLSVLPSAAEDRLAARDYAGDEPDGAPPAGNYTHWIAETFDSRATPRAYLPYQDDINRAVLDYYIGREAQALAFFRSRAKAEKDPICLLMLAHHDARTNSYHPQSYVLMDEARKATERYLEKYKAREDPRGEDEPGVLGSFDTLFRRASRENQKSFDPDDFSRNFFSPEGEQLLYVQAYYRYISGLFEEDRVEKAVDEASKKRHAALAADAFFAWKELLAVGPVARDVFHRRARAIALGDGIRGLSKIPENAYALWRDLDEAGLVDAKNRVGWMHFYHKLGEKSQPGTAHLKFKEAADLGNSSAMFNLAYVYLFGVGVPADREASRAWLDRAAKGGNDDPFLRKHVFDNPPLSWRAINEQGDELEVSLADPSGWPPLLKLYEKGGQIEGRVYALRVRYRLGSIGAARIFPDKGFAYRSAGPVLQDEGTRTVWVAQTAPAHEAREIAITLAHAADDKPVLSVRVPVIARWEK